MILSIGLHCPMRSAYLSLAYDSFTLLHSLIVFAQSVDCLGDTTNQRTQQLSSQYQKLQLKS